MKKIFVRILLSISLVLPCFFGFVACKELDNDIEYLSVDLKSNTSYVMTNNVITVDYGKNIALSANDFVVKAVYEDGSSKVISANSSLSYGYMFASSLPANVITPVGDYSIMFIYDDMSVVVTVKVVKASIDMSLVDWDYDGGFTYDGNKKSVGLVNIPEGVSVAYEGTTEATNAGEYTVIAKFTLDNSTSYAEIPDKTLTWKIQKAKINISEIEMQDFVYDSTAKNAEIKSISLPDGVTVKEIVSDGAKINAGEYDAKIIFDLASEKQLNYEVLDADVTWKILPGTYKNVGTISLTGQTKFNFDGTVKTVQLNLDNLNQNVRFKEASNLSKVNAGIYTIVVELEYVGEDLNYNSAESIVLENAWEIGKAILTIKPNDHAVVYGEGAKNNGFDVVSGLLNGDTKDVVKGEPVYSYGTFNAEGGRVGVYEISVSGLTADNYEINAEQTGILTVVKANVGSFENVKLKVDSLVYDGEIQTIADDENDFEGIPDGAKIVSMLGNTGKNVWESIGVHTKTLTLTFTQDDSGNYNDIEETVNLSWEIVPSELNVVINNQNIRYGDLASNAGFKVVEGLKGLDTVDVIKGVPTYTYGEYVVGSKVGSYPITIGEKDLYAENYTIVAIPGVLTVNPRAVDISSVVWQDVSNIVYNGEIQKPVLVNLSDFAIATYVYKDKEGNEVEPINAGDYVAVVSVKALNENCFIVESLSESEKTFTIKQASLSISELEWENVANIIYNGEVQKPELVTVPEGFTVIYKYTQNDVEVDPINAGDYVAKASFIPNNANYKVDGDYSLSFTIKPKDIDAEGFVWEYRSQFTYTGEKISPKLINLPDFVEANYVAKQNGEEVDPVNVGEYTISATFESLDSNYQVVGDFSEVEFSIVKAQLHYPVINESYVHNFSGAFDNYIYYSGQVSYVEEGYQFSIVDQHLYNVKHSTDNGLSYEGEGIPRVYGKQGENTDLQIALLVSLKEEHAKNYCFINNYHEYFVSINLTVSNNYPFKSLKLNGQDYDYGALLNYNKILVYGDVITFECNDDFEVRESGTQSIVNEIVVTNNTKTYTIAGKEFEVRSDYYLNNIQIDDVKIVYPQGSRNYELLENQSKITIKLPSELRVKVDSGESYKVIHINHPEGILVNEFEFSTELLNSISFYYYIEGMSYGFFTINIQKFLFVENIEYSTFDLRSGQTKANNFDVKNEGGLSVSNSIVTEMRAVDINGKYLLTKIYLDENLTKEVASFENCNIDRVYVAAYKDEETLLQVIPVNMNFSLYLEFENINALVTNNDNERGIICAGNVDSLTLRDLYYDNVTITIDGENTFNLDDIINVFNLQLTVNLDQKTYVFEKDIKVLKSEDIGYFSSYPELSDGNNVYNLVNKNNSLWIDDVLSYKSFESNLNNFEFNAYANYTVKSKEIVKLKDNNLYLKLIITDTNQEKDYNVYLAIFLHDGVIDSNTEAEYFVLDELTNKNKAISEVNGTIIIENPAIERLRVYLKNKDASAVLKDSNNVVISESDIIGLFYKFRSSGVYLLTITATDGTVREVSVIVNEILPLFEFTIENGENDIIVEQRLTDDGQPVGDFLVLNFGKYFRAYLENFDLETDVLTINNIRSALFCSTPIKLYKSYENGILSDEINVNNSFELTLDRSQQDCAVAKLYIDGVMIDNEATVMTIFFVISKYNRDLILNVSCGETNLNEYIKFVDEELVFEGDFILGGETTFVGYLGLDDYNEETITLDSISLGIYKLIEFENVEVNDLVSLKEIQLDENFCAEDVVLNIEREDGGAYCLIGLFGDGNKILQIKLFIGAQEE